MILSVIQQINNTAVLEASFARELEGDFHQNAIQPRAVPGARCWGQPGTNTELVCYRALGSEAAFVPLPGKNKKPSLL